MSKIVLKEFPIHVAITKNKTKADRFTKINNQSIYNGSLNRFSRNIAVSNMHKYIEDCISEIKVPKINYPVQLQISIYTVINHGNISRRNGKIVWKKPDCDYIPDWDEDNLRMLWEKCIKDSVSHSKVWPDDNAYYCRGTNAMVYFIENLEDRRIEISFKKIEDE